MELAAHKALAGAELQTLKDFATVLAKVPGLGRGVPRVAAGGVCSAGCGDTGRLG